MLAGGLSTTAEIRLAASLQLLEVAVCDVMCAPVRHRIELDTVRKLHLVLCLKPAALPGPLFFLGRGAITGRIGVAVGVSCVVVGCASVRLPGLRIGLELESVLVSLCPAWLRRDRKENAAAGIMVFSNSSSCPPSPVLGVLVSSSWAWWCSGWHLVVVLVMVCRGLVRSRGGGASRLG